MEKGRILVVDDDKSTRSLLHDYLTEVGHEVVTAVDGNEALQKFHAGTFDCVLSDLFMPNVDGFELLRRIKEVDKSVFFFLITGYPTIGSAVNAVKEGAYDYVTKPFNTDDIRIKIDRALETKKTAGSLKTMTGLFWGVILSIPIWLILGIVLGIVWK